MCPKETALEKLKEVRGEQSSRWRNRSGARGGRPPSSLHPGFQAPGRDGELYSIQQNPEEKLLSAHRVPPPTGSRVSEKQQGINMMILCWFQNTFPQRQAFSPSPSVSAPGPAAGKGLSSQGLGWRGQAPRTHTGTVPFWRLRVSQGRAAQGRDPSLPCAP